MINDWKIVKLLYMIGQDKWIHFTLSLILTIFLFAIGHIAGLGAIAAAPAIGITLLLGAGKEWYDSKHGGKFDHYDMVSDFLGCFVATVLISLLLI